MTNASTPNSTQQTPQTTVSAPITAEKAVTGGITAALDAFSGPADTFEDYMRNTAKRLGGGFLFALPASGLMDDCQRIAAIQIPEKSQNELKTHFVLLDATGENLRLRKNDDRLKELESFAGAFVNVLQQIGPVAESPSADSASSN